MAPQNEFLMENRVHPGRANGNITLYTGISTVYRATYFIPSYVVKPAVRAPCRTAIIQRLNWVAVDWVTVAGNAAVAESPYLIRLKRDPRKNLGTLFFVDRFRNRQTPSLFRVGIVRRRIFVLKKNFFFTKIARDDWWPNIHDK